MHLASTGKALSGALVAAYDTGTRRLVNSAFSNESGAYAIADLPNGTYDLVASAGGYRQAEALGRVVLDGPVTWDVGMLPQNVVLQGQVLDAAQHPVAGALVSAANSRGEVVMYATADYAGVFRMDELQAGVYSLQAHAYGFSPAEVTGVGLVEFQAADVDLMVTPTAMSTQPRLAELVRVRRPWARRSMVCCPHGSTGWSTT